MWEEMRVTMEDAVEKDKVRIAQKRQRKTTKKLRHKH